mmetsp:Transcript_141764/g.440757  ORF Transcript_141764/g.440757 Transcript_141764/m.440757 type:complete len:328 (-) Transcript_141764:594-1577(-)
MRISLRKRDKCRRLGANACPAAASIEQCASSSSSKAVSLGSASVASAVAPSSPRSLLVSTSFSRAARRPSAGARCLATCDPSRLQLHRLSSLSAGRWGSAAVDRASNPSSSNSLKAMTSFSRPPRCASPGDKTFMQSAPRSQWARMSSFKSAMCGRVCSASAFVPSSPNSLPRRLSLSSPAILPRCGAITCMAEAVRLQSVRLRSLSLTRRGRPSEARTSTKFPAKSLPLKLSVSTSTRYWKLATVFARKVEPKLEPSRSRDLNLWGLGVHSSFPKESARTYWPMGFRSPKSRTSRSGNCDAPGASASMAGLVRSQRLTSKTFKFTR